MNSISVRILAEDFYNIRSATNKIKNQNKFRLSNFNNLMINLTVIKRFAHLIFKIVIQLISMLLCAKLKQRINVELLCNTKTYYSYLIYQIYFLYEVIV